MQKKNAFILVPDYNLFGALHFQKILTKTLNFTILSIVYLIFIYVIEFFFHLGI